MPHQSTGFMQALDEWSQNTILDPLYDAWREVEGAPEENFQAEAQERLTKVVATIKHEIREKVLQSYRNGKKAAANTGGVAGAERPGNTKAAPKPATSPFRARQKTT